MGRPKTKDSYQAQCKTCNHEFRLEIEAQRLCKNMSFEDLVIFCRNELNYRISYKSIILHFSKHVTPERKMQVRHMFEQSEKDRKDRINKRAELEADLELDIVKSRLYLDEEKEIYGQIQALNVVIENNAKVLALATAELTRQFKEPLPFHIKLLDGKGQTAGSHETWRPKIDTALVTAFKTASETVTKAMKERSIILGLDPTAKQESQDKEVSDFLYNLVEQKKLADGNDEENDDKESGEVTFDDEDTIYEGEYTTTADDKEEDDK